MKDGMIARSRSLRALLAETRRFAATDANVLITGETGVGKDLFARMLHLSGPRRSQPFVQIDCPSLPPSLLESELFGYERGAFTDATTARIGRFEQAGRGTVYLDRVGELPLELQGKLLRLVEDKRGERLGGTTPFDVQARIVASAERPLEDAVREGVFRADLYHRLCVLPIHIPPLRERRADILPLARRFLKKAVPSGAAPPELTGAAAAALKKYRWPGNARELQHVLERAAMSSGGPRIDVTDLPVDLIDEATSAPPAQADRPATLDQMERRHIETTLRQVRGNQTKAAAILGISRKALWEKRRRYGLE